MSNDHLPRPAILDKLGTTITFSEGTSIMRPGVDADYVYEITSGLVKLYTLNDRKEQSIHIVFGPGDMFPLSWLIDQTPFIMHVRTCSEVHALRYPRQTFMNLVNEHPDISMFVISRLVNQLRLYVARVDNLEYRLASQRLAYRLLFIAQRFGVKRGTAIELPVFSNLDLGGMVNLSREYVNHELRRFVRQGFIAMKGKQICIADMEGLRLEVSKDHQPLFTHMPFGS